MFNQLSASSRATCSTTCFIRQKWDWACAELVSDQVTIRRRCTATMKATPTLNSSAFPLTTTANISFRCCAKPGRPTRPVSVLLSVESARMDEGKQLDARRLHATQAHGILRQLLPQVLTGLWG